MAKTADTKEVLRQHLESLQEKAATLKAPLEAARAERDGFIRDNHTTFTKERELSNKVRKLQNDPAITDIEREISATARALDGLRMGG